MVAASAIAVCFVAMTSAAPSARQMKLTQVMEQSIRKVFPNARIEEVEQEKRIVTLIEVTVVEDGQEHEVTLTQDGTILSIGQGIDPDELPATVRDAILGVTGTVVIHEAERIKVLAELRAVAIKQPRTEYEAEFQTQGREKGEVTVSEDGATKKTLKQLRFDDD